MSKPKVMGLHRTLACKYHTHGSRIKELWHDMTPAQREKVMKARAFDDSVLSHSDDDSTGFAYSIMPEWNLKDVTTGEPDFFLHMFEHRATKTLQEQYTFGFDGRPGDFEHIHEMMRTRDLRHPESFPTDFTMFLDGEFYGVVFSVVQYKREISVDTRPYLNPALYIPRSTGELVLLRQSRLLEALNSMIENILNEALVTRSEKKPPEKHSEAITSAIVKISIASSIPELNMSSLVYMASNQKDSFQNKLTLLNTKPNFLCQSLRNWLSGRPELVADEQGRILPAHTGKSISGAFLDTIHNAVKGAGNWAYIEILLGWLKDLAGLPRRNLVVQEIANVCHFEYTRAQARLRCQMSMTSGSKWFKRLYDTSDNGNARITLKVKPEALATRDLQLQYLLRLCQVETNAPKAVEWVTKLDEFHIKFPKRREELHEWKTHALDDVAVIVAFVQSLSAVIALPALNCEKGLGFVSRATNIETELNNIKPNLNLTAFAYPIDNLLKAGKTKAAMKALKKFIVERTGTELGHLYLNLIPGCLDIIRDEGNAHSSNDERLSDVINTEESKHIPLNPEPSTSSTTHRQGRRQKRKTRSAHSRVYEIASSANLVATAATQAPTTPSEPFEVKPAVAETFCTLFNRSESRGSISWVQFVAALTELGFSVIPKFGSAYTFYPPETMETQKSLTLHRPHGSRVERHWLLAYAHRLNRTYGWDDKTFRSRE
ncbi:hypothetical protein GGS21DRAFT_420987 [Xylaria nigripes]|nr:hypothetical protein GGS21DRAFT_420987 [Xylaria nigripes]